MAVSRYASLYWWFLMQRLKIMMEYRVNFLIGAGSTVVMQGAGLLAVWVVMTHVPSLNGWTYDEILLVYGLVTLAKSLNHMFADNLWTLGRDYIRTGGFDRFLVRPVNPLFHLLADRFCHDGIGYFLIGLAVVAKSAIALGILWTPWAVLNLIIGVISGGTIFLALNLITAVSAFWIMDSVPVTRAVFDLHEFAKYPLSMYRKGIGLLLTWFVPYGFASFYPASFLLGREAGALSWAAPLVAGVLLMIGYRLWQFGLRHYHSTGS